MINFALESETFGSSEWAKRAHSTSKHAGAWRSGIAARFPYFLLFFLLHFFFPVAPPFLAEGRAVGYALVSLFLSRPEALFNDHLMILSLALGLAIFSFCVLFVTIERESERAQQYASETP